MGVGQKSKAARAVGDAVEPIAAGLAEKMVALRKSVGISAKELAERIGFTQAQVSRLENGRHGFRAETLLRIAKALGIDPVYFFVDEKDVKSRSAAKSAALSRGALAQALKKADFVAFVERLAKAYQRKDKSYKAIVAAADAILGDR